jgi:hypothetical protein
MNRIKELLNKIIPLREKNKKKHKPKQTIVRTYPIYLFNSSNSDTVMDTGTDI